MEDPVDAEMFYSGKEFCLGFQDAKLYKEHIEQALENYPEYATDYPDISLIPGKIFICFPFFRDIHIDLLQTMALCYNSMDAAVVKMHLATLFAQIIRVKS